MSIEALLVTLITIVIGVAVGLYKHVSECRKVHETLGRIMEHLGMKE